MGFDEASGKGNENFFTKIVANLWEGVFPYIKLWTKYVFEGLKEQTPDSDGMRWEIWCKKLKTDGYIDEDTMKLIISLKDEGFPMNVIGIMMTRVAIFKTEIDNVMNIYGLDRQYRQMAKTTPHPAPVDALIRAMFIDPARTTANRVELGKHGFDKTQIDNMILAQYRTAGEGTIRMLYLRKIISVELMYERMRELGYTDVRIKEIVQTWVILPGPQDLFFMVAKEAFEPDMYIKLGLDKDFPEEQVKWLEQQGISKDWAKKYWIAHWAQPSIGQGFEMLHRDVITAAELDLLFRAVEIPSFWRDKLTAIAYQPYTRVDARRMHDLGILKDEDLVRAYKDIGYDSEHALEMAKFTLKFNASKEKELTRGAILDSYEIGLIDRADAKSLLMAGDYSLDLAEYYLTLSDFKAEQETQNLHFDNIKQKFLINKLSAAEVTKQLTQMGLNASRITALLANWSLQAYQYELLPTKSELTDFLLRGVINEDQYRQTMSQTGYDAASINWYLEAIKTPTTASARRVTKSELGKFLTTGIIMKNEYVSEMTDLGYSTKYINWYLADLNET